MLYTQAGQVGLPELLVDLARPSSGHWKLASQRIKEKMEQAKAIVVYLSQNSSSDLSSVVVQVQALTRGDDGIRSGGHIAKHAHEIHNITKDKLVPVAKAYLTSLVQCLFSNGHTLKAGVDAMAPSSQVDSLILFLVRG